MSEVIQRLIKPEPPEQIKARLQTVLQETRKDEAQLRRVLEMRRLERRAAGKRPK